MSTIVYHVTLGAWTICVATLGVGFPVSCVDPLASLYLESCVNVVTTGVAALDVGLPVSCLVSLLGSCTQNMKS